MISEFIQMSETETKMRKFVPNTSKRFEDTMFDYLEHKLTKSTLSILRKTSLKTRNSVQGNGGFQGHMQVSLSKSNVGISKCFIICKNLKFLKISHSKFVLQAVDVC